MTDKRLSILVRDSVDSLYGAEASACFYLWNHGGMDRDFLILLLNDFYARRFYEVLACLFENPDSDSFNTPEILFLPGWDTLPFEVRSPELTLVSERSRTLARLIENRASGRRTILACSIPGFSQKLISPERFQLQQLSFKIKDSCSVLELVESLEWIGYVRATQVEDLGQYAVRGSVVDIFSPFYDEPVRIQFFGSAIESIRFFECASQKSLKEANSILVLPVREFGFTARNAKDDVISKGIPRFRALSDEFSLASSERRVREENLKQGILWNGGEIFSHYLFDEGVSLTEYFQEHPFQCFAGDVDSKTHVLSWNEMLLSRFEYSKEKGEMLPPPESLYVSEEVLLDTLATVPSLRSDNIFNDAAGSFSLIESAPLLLDRIHSSSQFRNQKSDIFQEMFSRLKGYIRDGYVVILLFPSEEKLIRMRELLEERSLEGRYSEHSLAHILMSEAIPGLYYGISALPEGFLYSDRRVLVLTERELFSRLHQAPSRRKTFRRSSFRRHITSLAQIELGDYVVHEQYGIGKFLGLRPLNLQGLHGEFLDIEYAGGAKLYVPVHDFLKVGKYSSSNGDSPVLTRLGSGSWERIKAKVSQNIAALTGSLLKTMAVRSISKGYSFGKLSSEDEWFAGLFPYEETGDQLRAIEAVFSDMNLEKPMDRLVCGDVGFGKTEVALRAAFKAAMHGKQVAVLVPTTILAEQHYRTFTERFEATPLSIRVLSRFVTGKDQVRIVSELHEGTIDIIIGTHRLLQSDIAFKDLGLLVIDEEHRFGVAHKERFKQLRSEVDVLSLSATPIPRTLQMALFGTKDLSIIETPPIDRQAVHTEVLPYNEDVCIEAIRRELAREGQVFVVHHYIEGLDEIAGFIKSRLPLARIGIVHGRIPKKDLESKMHEFYAGHVDILLATSIIESGLDIPNANTIVILKAEQFGLAQLYQLRGRVGRSSKKGYAYLFHSHQSVLADNAKKRLYAMSHMDEMGVGYRVALQDMEIRGAGSLLGKDQSGHVQLLGYDMYIKVLEEAVRTEREKRGGLVKDKELSLFPSFEPDVVLDIDAFIPEDFIPDINERLLMYQVVSGLCFDQEVEDFYEDMQDRFGEVPDEIRSLVFLMRVRNYCKHTGVQKFIRKESSIFISLLSTKILPDPRPVILLECAEVSEHKNSMYVYKCNEDSSKDIEVLLELFDAMYRVIQSGVIQSGALKNI